MMSAMPMLDLHIPLGALEAEQERQLVERITTILIRHEGFDPADPVTRSVSWAFVHRPEVYVGGDRSSEPRYKIVASVPEGQLTGESRATLVAQVTEAVLDAEHGSWPRDPGRVWVFPTDVPEGRWGGRGQIIGLADILSRLTDGDDARARALAEPRIAAARGVGQATTEPRAGNGLEASR
jgi:phenylpyruvate tautomerase PptA (4-oxalocrotonate tautomerase family)